MSQFVECGISSEAMEERFENDEASRCEIIRRIIERKRLCSFEDDEASRCEMIRRIIERKRLCLFEFFTWVGGRKKANIIVPSGIRAQGWLVMADLLWKLLFVGMKVKNVTMEDGKKNRVFIMHTIWSSKNDFLCYPIEVNKALLFGETKEQGDEFGGYDRFFVFPFGWPNNGGDREVEAKELQGIPSGCFL
ncbi:hypothetical protein U1Q18_027908 [Sarracenia purpurea var. burkii]